MKTLAKLVGVVMIVVSAYALYNGIEVVISLNTVYLILGIALAIIPK